MCIDWLFNLLIDSCLQDLKDDESGCVAGWLFVKYLLYAGDLVLLASSAVVLRATIYETFCMEVNVSKTKVMVLERDEVMTDCEIMISDERLQQVEEFVHLGTLFKRDEKHERDIEKGE
jgi:hypothetical protein